MISKRQRPVTLGRWWRLTSTLLLLALAVTSAPSPVYAGAPANEPFQRTWERTDQPVQTGAVDRTWMWGPSPFTGALMEAYEESPGGKRPVQYFDKSRMEISDPDGDPGELWYVTNGRLVAEMLRASVQIGDAYFVGTTPDRPPEINVAGDQDDPNGPTYQTFRRINSNEPFPQGHLITEVVDREGQISTDASLAAFNVTAAYLVDVPGIRYRVASPFWAFMNSSGPVWVDGAVEQGQLFPDPFYATGLPLTDAYWAHVLVGGETQAVLTQCFERRCLTYTPANPAGWQVEAGNVGRHYYEWRYGSEPVTEYAEPHAVAVSGTDVYVGSGRNNQIFHFSTDGTYLGQWGGGQSGQFLFPTGIAIHQEDTLYIIEHLRHRISVYSTDGDYQFQWGRGGSEPGLFRHPYGIAISIDGVVYISDKDNHRIQMFDLQGNYLDSFGSAGSNPGQFAFPSGLAFDNEGNLLVVDTGNYRVQRFDPEGTYLGQWGHEGSDPGEFGLIRGIAVTEDGRILVAEGLNDRIQVFSADGTSIETWPIGDSPAGVAVGPDGSVFVTDASFEVYKLDPDGTNPSRLSVPPAP